MLKLPRVIISPEALEAFRRSLPQTFSFADGVLMVAKPTITPIITGYRMTDEQYDMLADFGGCEHCETAEYLRFDSATNDEYDPSWHRETYVCLACGETSTILVRTSEETPLMVEVKDE